jgi:hypothetical protein
VWREALIVLLIVLAIVVWNVVAATLAYWLFLASVAAAIGVDAWK